MMMMMIIMLPFQKEILTTRFFLSFQFKSIQKQKQDINAALRIRMCEPLYGFPSNMPSQEFVKVKGTNDVFYTYDEELDVNKLLSEPLPPPSIAINVVPHWLAIDGVQPLIPENPSLDSQIYYQERAKERENRRARVRRIWRA